MHLAHHILRVVTSVAAVSAVTFALPTTAHSDRVPLVGSGTAAPNVSTRTISSAENNIIFIDPTTAPCNQIATFSDVVGGETPGTNYDGFIWSGGMQFAERFVGQTVGSSGDFDAIAGGPDSPLMLQVGAPGQNLDVFVYTTNVLAGLGALAYPDLDAIGEGSIAMLFPSPQSRVSFEIVGGNGGSATLGFYRSDGSLIDNVVVSGLADLAYGFATADASPSISGILIQNTDASRIGIVNVCHDGGTVSSRSATWGNIKRLYR